MKRSMTNGCHTKEKSNSIHFGHWKESITIFNPIDIDIFFATNQALR